MNKYVKKIRKINYFFLSIANTYQIFYYTIFIYKLIDNVIYHGKIDIRWCNWKRFHVFKNVSNVSKCM